VRRRRPAKQRIWLGPDRYFGRCERRIAHTYTNRYLNSDADGNSDRDSNSDRHSNANGNTSSKSKSKCYSD
jgi:hypothetical protein